MENGRKNRVVVLVPCPLEGHLPAMLQFGTLLHSKGFSITIAHTNFNSPNPSNYPFLKFVELEDGLAGSCDTTCFNLFTVIPAINRNCKEPLKKFLSEEDSGVCCVIYDPVMYYTDEVVKDLKIPGLIFRTSSAAYMQATRVSLNLHAQLDGTLIPEFKLQDLVPVLDHLRFKDLPIPFHIHFPQKVIEWEEDMSCIKSSPVAIILNSATDLENSVLHQLEKECEIPFFPLGPLHKMVSIPSNSTTDDHLEDERICMEWLDIQGPNSVVYVSFGSVVTIEEKDVIEIAWGLVNSGLPFLWVVRPGLIQGSKWIENLPEEFLEKYNKQKGLIVKWAPQKEVLAHPGIGVFWSHCGWNSTLESIYEGVPMMCRPLFADQKVNARYLTHVWKVAIELESPLLRGDVENAIRRVVVDDQGKELKINALKLKKKLEDCVKEDGSSCKSLDKLVEFIYALPKTT